MDGIELTRDERLWLFSVPETIAVRIAAKVRDIVAAADYSPGASLSPLPDGSWYVSITYYSGDLAVRPIFRFYTAPDLTVRCVPITWEEIDALKEAAR